MVELQNPKPDPSEPQKTWLGIILFCVLIGGCLVWKDQQHQDYLNRTTPERRAIDREQMQYEDAMEDARNSSYRGY
jgi:hypothetical protein